MFSNGQVIGIDSDSLNYALYKMVHDIEMIELEYIRQGTDISLGALKEVVRSERSKEMRLKEFGLDAIRHSGISELTAANYRTLLNSIDLFRKGTLLSDIDSLFISRYDIWLKSKGIRHNTRISRLRMLKALTGKALRMGLISENPFGRFRIPGTIPRKGYLNASQLEIIESMRLKGSKDIVRDAFLLGCYTGLRFSDISTLKQNEIRDGWIVKKMRKTGKTVEIPLEAISRGKALKIIEKYGGNIENLTKRIGTNQYVNRTFKKILDNAGLPRSLTFHSSRHTCATLLGQAGIDLTIIQKILGHTKIQTTAIYRETDRASILAALKHSSDRH